MEPGLERAKAIARFIAEEQDKIREATRLRYEDLAVLHEQIGSAETVRRTGLSRSTVKTAVVVTDAKIGKPPPEVKKIVDPEPDLDDDDWLDS